MTDETQEPPASEATSRFHTWQSIAATHKRIWERGATLVNERLQQEQEGKASEEGMAKISEGDYRAAVALLRPLAEEGNVFALFDIGFIAPILLDLSDPDLDRSFLIEDEELDRQFQDRTEPLLDSVRAEIKWYTRASAQGNPEAIFQLLRIYKHWSLGPLPWHSLTGILRELYELAENGGYFAAGPALLDVIRAEMRAAGLTPKTVFHQRD